MKSAEKTSEAELGPLPGNNITTLSTDKCIILPSVNSMLDRILGKFTRFTCDTRNYSSEFTEGKMIGGKMFY